MDLERQTKKETVKSLSEVEMQKLLFNVTLPSVELELVTGFPQGYRGRYPTSYSIGQAIPLLAESARIAADTQNIGGIRIGYYREGSIIDGRYTYENGAGMGIRRNYKPRIFNTPRKILEKHFPGSSPTTYFVKDIPASDNHPLGLLPDHANLAASMIFIGLANSESLVDGEPKGEVTMMRYLGLPILYCENDDDFLALNPHAGRHLPKDVQAYSYVTGRFTKPFNRESKFTDFPLVVCRSELIQQPEIGMRLLEKQLFFAEVVSPKAASPVFVSRNADTLEKQRGEKSKALRRFALERTLARKIKDHVIELVIRETGAIEWTPEYIRKRLINNARSELFVNQQSKLYIGDRLSSAEVFGSAYQERLVRVASDTMNKAMLVINAMVAPYRSREIGLLVANLLPYFDIEGESANDGKIARPGWADVEKAFYKWEDVKKGQFMASFKIPRTRVIQE